MNIQRFIIPATVAAAFHAALFLHGKPPVHFPPVVVAKAPPERKQPPEQRMIEVPLVNDPLDATQEMPTALAQGRELPSLEEIFTDRSSDFQMPVDHRNSRKIDLPPTTTIGPIGDPAGIPGVTTIKGSIFNLTQLDKIPQATVRTSPTYPSALKNEGIEGVVMIEFDVDTKGRVVSARVRQSSDRAFDEPTLRAVLNWRFEPGRKDGRAVPFRMVIPVNFKLGEA